MSAGNRPPFRLDRLEPLLVPAVVFSISMIAFSFGKTPFSRLIVNLEQQFSRNVFLVLALIIPVVAGLGLNFAVVVGAMAGQLAILTAEDRGWSGGSGLLGALGLAVALGGLAGLPTGALLNRARGREMICGLIFGYFASGVYQFLLLILAGPVLPFSSQRLLLPSGVGLRSTLDLKSMGQAVPGLWAYLLLLGLAVLLLSWLFRTKLGQDWRAVGLNRHVAAVAGIAVERTRLLAMVFSTVLGAAGQVLYLQDFSTLNTYTQHDQVGFYAVAALLVGGATVQRATVLHAVLGTALFHLLILTAVPAMAQLVGNSQIEEYCRELFVFLIIGVSLVVHAWRAGRQST
ncbi:MAG: ABC transporter permease [Planctomycetes bacterium]|nr:ABC transporter permease [Planctomycetota bacterium]